MNALSPADPAAPETAWQNGLTAARLGDYETARLWLDRACRLAPNDPRIALDLANTLIAMGGPERLAAAAVTFSRIAEQYDAVPAWLGLLTVRRLNGDHAAAAEALGSILSRHCIPDDPAFHQAAALVAEAVGAHGWRGMKAAGQMQCEPPEDGGGADRIGNPDLVALRRVEGVVSVVDGSLLGWAMHSSCPAMPPSLRLADAKGVEMPVVFGTPLPPNAQAPFAMRHSFAVPARSLKDLTAPYRIITDDGVDIPGSPLDPAVLDEVTPVPAWMTGPPVRRLPARAKLAVVVPVYRGMTETAACLKAVSAVVPQGATVIVVDDATPEPELAAWLDGLAATKQIVLIRHARNLGFPEAANAGLRAAGKRDVLLLNSDTLVPPGAIEALTAAAYATAETGSATPLSNEATILSYPDRYGGNAAPGLAGAAALQKAAAEANGRETVEIPTAVGFCMLMRHDCLAATGLFRVGLFTQGYGEENDWCVRARHLGFRHVAAAGAYVAHAGGVSFRAARHALAARNVRILNRLYPGYDAMIASHIEADPLREARRRLDMARLRARPKVQQGAVLLISHNHGGGVARKIESDRQAFREQGLRPLLLIPAAPEDPMATPFPWQSQLTDARPGDYPNLRFTLPDEQPALVSLLRELGVGSVVLHHALGHHPAVRRLAADLGVRQEMVLHDYASFCPRVNLLSRAAAQAPLRYCGEPDVAGCNACVAAWGDETFEGLGVAAVIERSAREFAASRRIVAPSADIAQRISRHFPGVRPDVIAWEDDGAPVTLKPPGTGRRRIIVIGGIGPAKGFDVLIGCARDARQRNLKLEFIVAGASAEDKALMEAGIFVTGAYAEGEATKLVASLQGDLVFLPSIWPETWCYTLSEAWRAGLYVLAFDLGAQAARIRATGQGAVLPLGLPIGRVNDALCAWNPALTA